MGSSPPKHILILILDGVVDLLCFHEIIFHSFVPLGLIYNLQSGGMNEAFSDIAGEAAEYYLSTCTDWLVNGQLTRKMQALR